MKKIRGKRAAELALLLLAAVSCAVLFASAAAVNATARAAAPPPETVSVSDEAGLRDALESTPQGAARTVLLTQDLRLTGGTLTATGSVTLTGTGMLTLAGTGGANGQIAVAAGAELTVRSLAVDQPEANGPMFYLRGDAVLNLDGVVLTGASRGVYRVLSADGGNAAFYLNDTSLRCGEAAYPFNRGNFVFSGMTSYEGKFPAASDVNAPYCYDFRGVNVAASPLPEAFAPLDEVSLTLTKQGTFFKGMGAPQETDGVIWYTVDGSDPRFSETAEEFTAPFRLLVSGTVRAAFRFRGFYQYAPDAFPYELYPDEPPGTAAAFEAFEDIAIRCGDTLSQADFPDVVTVRLEDGRSFRVSCDWGDVTRYRFYEAGTESVYGTVVLPAFIANPNALRPQRSVVVTAEQLRDFTCSALDSAQEGKNTVEDGAAVARFSASGGNNYAYEYALSERDGLGKDNGRFLIEEDRLIVAGEALTAGTYEIYVEVKSGGMTLAAPFAFTVKPRGTELLIVDPYASVDWGSVNQVKTATHDHTVNTNNNTGWSDNVSDTPDERVAYYRGLGYGAVIIADHDYVSYPWNADGTYPMKHMLGIPGSELSKNQHVLSYNCNYYDYESQGPAKKHTFEENVVGVHEAGGFIYLAHPCRNDPSTPHSFWYDIVEKYPWVYGMEVLNAGQFSRNHSEGLWDEILTRNMPYRNLWGTASDDAHSNAAAGTGWATLLLSEDEMNSEGVANALMNGKYYFSSYRVEIGKDDNKRDPGVPAPKLNSVAVDRAAGTIALQAENVSTIEWISAGGAVVAVGATLDVNRTYGTGKYVRARLKGAGGQTLTQPFALYEKDDARFAESVTADYENERLNFDEDTVEADTTGSFNGAFLKSGAALTPGQTVYLRGKRGTGLEGYAAVITVGSRPAPPQLTAAEVTETSIALSPAEGAEYRLENGAWQASPIFEGLAPDTGYRVYARIAAASGRLRSEEVSEAFRTKAAAEGAPQTGCGCGTTAAGGGGAGLSILLLTGGAAVLAAKRRLRRRT